MSRTQNSSNSSPVPRRKQYSWTDWEAGLLLLTLDWFTSRGKAKATWVENDDGDSIVERFNDWRIFLNDSSNSLERSNRPNSERLTTKNLKGKLERLELNDDPRKRAVDAVQHQLLPLREKLQDEFGIKICYIRNDKLPGSVTIPERNSAGSPAALAKHDRYAIVYSRVKQANIKSIYFLAKAEREKRETAYDKRLTQTEDDEEFSQIDDDDDEGSPQTDDDEGSPQTEDDHGLPQTEDEEEFSQTDDDDDDDDDEGSPQTEGYQGLPQTEDDEENPQTAYDIAFQKNLAMM